MKKSGTIKCLITFAALAAGIGITAYLMRNKKRTQRKPSKTNNLSPPLLRSSPHSKETDANDIKLKGNQLFKDGKFREAISYYQQAISSNPSKPEFYGNRALAYIKIEQYEEGLTDANKMIELDPACSKAYHLKALCLLNLGKLIEAQDGFKKALEIAPHNTAALTRFRECEQRIMAESNTSDPEEFSKKLGAFLDKKNEDAKDIIVEEEEEEAVATEHKIGEKRKIGAEEHLKEDENSIGVEAIHKKERRFSQEREEEREVEPLKIDYNEKILKVIEDIERAAGDARIAEFDAKVSEIYSDSIKRESELDENAPKIDQNEPKTIEIDQNEPKPIKIDQNDPKTTEIDQNDPKTTEIDQNEPKTTENDQNEPKTTEIDQNDPKTTEIDQKDPKTTEIDQNDPKTTEIDQNDPKPIEITAENESKTIEITAENESSFYKSNDSSEEEMNETAMASESIVETMQSEMDKQSKSKTSQKGIDAQLMESLMSMDGLELSQNETSKNEEDEASKFSFLSSSSSSLGLGKNEREEKENEKEKESGPVDGEENALNRFSRHFSQEVNVPVKKLESLPSSEEE